MRNLTGGGKLPSDCPDLTDLDKKILSLITNAEPLPAKQEKPNCSTNPKPQPPIKAGDRLVDISSRKEVMQRHLGSLKSLLLIKQLADPSLQGIEAIHRRIIQSTGQILAENLDDEDKENFKPQNTSAVSITESNEVFESPPSMFNDIFAQFNQGYRQF